MRFCGRSSSKYAHGTVHTWQESAAKCLCHNYCKRAVEPSPQTEALTPSMAIFDRNDSRPNMPGRCAACVLCAL